MEMLSSSGKMDVTQHALIIQIIVLSFVQHGFCCFVDTPGEKRNYIGNSVDMLWKWDTTIQSQKRHYDFCVFTSDLSNCRRVATIAFGIFNVEESDKGRVVENNPDSTYLGFTLHNVTRRDAGRYLCTLRMGSSVISDNTSFIFIYGTPKKPTITAQPTGNINESGSVRLTCSSTVTSVPAANASNLAYTWRRDGEPLSSDAKHNLSSQTDGRVLVIDPVTRDDQVNYRCLAQEQGSKLTSPKSAIYHIDVLWSPSQSTLHSNATGYVVEGGSVQLSCTTADVGEPAARTVWMKDGVEHKHKYTELTMVLNPIYISQHDGNWACSLSNSQTTQPLTSNTVNITVISPPEVKRHPENTTIEDRGPLNVSCQYEGKPHVHVEWKSNTGPLPTALKLKNFTSANGKFILTTSTLTWNTQDLMANQRAIGHYQCVGSNAAQSNIPSREMFLNVTCPPAVTRTDPANRIRAVPLGHASATFTLHYYANPDAQFCWEFYAVTNNSRATGPSNVEIQSEISGFNGTAKLIVINVTQNNFGTYRINASNTVGSLRGDQVNFTLQAHGPPNGPTNLKLEQSAPYSMTLSWLRGFDGGPQQTFWITYVNLNTGTFYRLRNIPDNSPHHNGSIYHTVFQGIEPSQRYLFTVGAVNIEGNATAYEQATFESPASSKMVVIAVGVVISVIILVVVVVVFAVLAWRGILLPKKDKGETKNSGGSKSSLVSGTARAVQMEDGAAINNHHLAAAAAAPARTPVKEKKTKAALSGESEPTVDDQRCQYENVHLELLPTATSSLTQVDPLDIGMVMFANIHPQQSEEQTMLEPAIYEEIPDIESVYQQLCSVAKEKVTGPCYASVMPKLQSLQASDIVFGDVIYRGTLHTVVKAKYGDKDVTSKTISDNRKMDKHVRSIWKSEVITLLTAGSHPNILSAMGMTTRHGLGCMLFPLSQQGNLESYLRGSNDSPEYENWTNVLPYDGLFRLSEDIATGMSYLHSKQLLHPCLRAQEVYIGEDNLAKISGFLNKKDAIAKLEMEAENNTLPVRWLGPEVIKDCTLLDEKSDVWSYGIVLWEIFTLGRMPYEGMEAEDINRFVSQGQVLPKPEMCSTEVLDLMKRCWLQTLKFRLTFDQVLDFLHDIKDT